MNTKFLQALRKNFIHQLTTSGLQFAQMGMAAAAYDRAVAAAIKQISGWTKLQEDT
jgi:hypothetical protein